MIYFSGSGFDWKADPNDYQVGENTFSFYVDLLQPNSRLVAMDLSVTRVASMRFFAGQEGSNEYTRIQVMTSDGFYDEVRRLYDRI